jgi:FkbM family methyltransferase
MADVQTLFGIARSLAIYYAQPWRRRALRRFYGEMIAPGDLVFDIGAHVGNRSVTLAGLGARVVAVEPQPALAAFLDRHVVGGDIRLVREAVGREAGQATLHVSRRNPTVSTLSHDWIRTVGASDGFRQVNWDREITVPVTTLDDLIARFGRPRFCKIDVEGMEAEILRGLSSALQLIAFEHLPEAPAASRDCIARLADLGDYRFNLVIGEDHRFVCPDWITGAEMLERLAPGPDAGGRGGDVYARLLQGGAD